MSFTASSRKRLLSLITAMSVLGLLVAPLGGVAQANHSNYTLQVTPEVSENTVDDGSSQALVARIQCSGTCNEPDPLNLINIDFEIESGPSANNSDGNTPQSPDRTCDIGGDIDDPTTTTRDESKSCSVRIEGTAEGVTFVRAWIDHDKIQTTVEADPNEGRYAGPSDCTSPDDSDLNGNGVRDCEEGVAQPGTGSPNLADCPAASGSTEPDCTDVVQINFVADDPEIVDCDDPTGPDTERETRQLTVNESVTYTCFVSDFNGNPRANIQVSGENESTVNDPDPSDGPSYSSPDYGCTSDAGGSCQVTVTAVENETGTATICWFAGTSSLRPPERECTNESTGENQNSNGSDTGNDRADKTEVTWVAPGSAQSLDCEPETDVNPTGTAHTITCTAKDSTGGGVGGTIIDVEATGANDPDRSNTPLVPDFSCTTGPDGSCSFRHTGAETGTTTYRAFIDEDDDDTTVEADTGENQADNDADKTDVVTKEWVSPPATLTISPKSDTAEIGECNPFTITASTSSGAPARGATIDVEQVHQQSTGENQPTVAFCVPTEGENPSDVDTSEGDRQPSADTAATDADEEDPDEPGTAGGETVQQTNQNGKVTIGITVEGNSTNNGAGTVEVTAFFDRNNNDDPDADEPKDTATKTWTSPAAPGGRSIDCEPETATTSVEDQHTVTCTVTDSQGDPASGVSVTFTEDGPGQFTTSTEATTNASGQASATVSSSEDGVQSITGTITSSTQSEPDTDECDRAAGDPAGSEQGTCSDTVTNTWEGAAEEKCPGLTSDQRNHVVGTEGDDTLQGTEGDDVICGLGGNDLIDGLGGNDLILGGDGNDSLRGGDGNDSIQGEAGKDELRGNSGNDVLEGGDQNDDLRGNAGDDELFGEGGFDVLRGGGGDDDAYGGSGNDTIQGFIGNDTLVGNAGNDTMKGAGGADVLRGGKDDDVISGGKGPDKINGGSGRDTCAGGNGRDTIRGCEN